MFNIIDVIQMIAGTAERHGHSPREIMDAWTPEERAADEARADRVREAEAKADREDDEKAEREARGE